MHEVYVVAAVRKNGVPTPQCYGATDRHGQHDEEIFIGNGGDERIECAVAAQETDERAIFLKHEKRDQDSRHGQEDEHHSHAKVQLVGAEFSAAFGDAADKKTQQMQRRALRINLPTCSEGLLPRIHEGDTTTSTISLATCEMSLSSTSWRKMRSSEDWPIWRRTSSVEP